MNEEYRAIVDAGFLVQIDDPRLITHFNRTPGLTVEDCRRFIACRCRPCVHYRRFDEKDQFRARLVARLGA